MKATLAPATIAVVTASLFSLGTTAARADVIPIMPDVLGAYCETISGTSSCHSQALHAPSASYSFDVSEDETRYIVDAPWADAMANYRAPYTGYNHTLIVGGYYPNNIVYDTPYTDSAIGTTAALPTMPSGSGWIVNLAGFASADHVQHVVAGTTTGAIEVLDYGPGITTPVWRVITSTVLNNWFSSFSDLTAYDSQDGYYHIIVATSTGIWEIYYNTSGEWHDELKSGLSNVETVAAMYVSGTHPNVVVYSTSGTSNNLNYFEYGGGITATTSYSSANAIIDTAVAYDTLAYASHVVVAETNNAVYTVGTGGIFTELYHF
jgi:hypothetical protein